MKVKLQTEGQAPTCGCVFDCLCVNGEVITRLVVTPVL